MGVRTVIVAVNKMDAVDWEHVVFEELAGGLRSAAARFELDEVKVVPVSALTGDNVIERSEAMPWYHGPTVLQALTSWLPSEVDEGRGHAAALPRAVRRARRRLPRVRRDAGDRLGAPRRQAAGQRQGHARRSSSASSPRTATSGRPGPARPWC